MIATTLSDGREVRILFAHNDYKKKALAVALELGQPNLVVDGVAMDARTNRPGAYKVYTHATSCAIVQGPKEQEDVLGEGEAWCALGDNFCRKTGRELALKRAIQNGGFGRVDSGLLFACYYNRNKGPRKPINNQPEVIA